MKLFTLGIFFLFALANTSFCQVVTYNGVIKITPQQSIKPINGIWNSADHTGNVVIDKVMDKFAAIYKLNTKLTRALEGTAAAVKTNPQAFIDQDGSINVVALQQALNQKFASAGEVTVPSIQLAVDSTGGLR